MLNIFFFDGDYLVKKGAEDLIKERGINCDKSFALLKKKEREEKKDADPRVDDERDVPARDCQEQSEASAATPASPNAEAPNPDCQLSLLTSKGKSTQM